MLDATVAAARVEDARAVLSPVLSPHLPEALRVFKRAEHTHLRQFTTWRIATRGMWWPDLALGPIKAVSNDLSNDRSLSPTALLCRRATGHVHRVRGTVHSQRRKVAARTFFSLFSPGCYCGIMWSWGEGAGAVEVLVVSRCERESDSSHTLVDFECAVPSPPLGCGLRPA